MFETKSWHSTRTLTSLRNQRKIYVQNQENISIITHNTNHLLMNIKLSLQFSSPRNKLFNEKLAVGIQSSELDYRKQTKKRKEKEKERSSFRTETHRTSNDCNNRFDFQTFASFSKPFK